MTRNLTERLPGAEELLEDALGAVSETMVGYAKKDWVEMIVEKAEAWLGFSRGSP